MKRKAKVLYHGTAFDFERFDEGALGSSVNNPTTGFGFFFTESIEDAVSWAQKSARRCFGGRRDPRVVEVRLALQKPVELDYPAFHYYLQRARAATILKHRRQWLEQGYDGLTLEREGVRWYAAFKPEAVEITRILQGSDLERERQAARGCVIEAYHGTEDCFDRFIPSVRGSFGSGIYLADEAAASEYVGDGAMVLRVQATFSNPYRCSASYEHDVDLESPAVDLIRTLFPTQEANRLIARAMIGDDGFGFGAEIQRALEGMGYDGLIATYSDGSQEIVAFAPEQVVILERRMLGAEPVLDGPAP